MKKYIYSGKSARKIFHDRTGNADVAYAMRIFSNVQAKLNLHIFSNCQQNYKRKK